MAESGDVLLLLEGQKLEESVFFFFRKRAKLEESVTS